MRLRATLSSQAVLSLILIWAVPVLAGPPSPCVKAASSENVGALVIANVQVEPLPGGNGIARVQQLSFEVFPQEKYVNAKDRTTTRATFWADWKQWGIVLDARDKANWAFTSCPLPLVTDDGEFLILLATVPAGSGDWGVLRIYRWDRGEGRGRGRLIREIPLKEFWIPLRLTWPLAWPPWPSDAPEEMASDERRPQWYAGGNFSFSLDNRSLIHKTQRGNTIRISLENGSVSDQ